MFSFCSRLTFLKIIGKFTGLVPPPTEILNLLLSTFKNKKTHEISTKYRDPCLCFPDNIKLPYSLFSWKMNASKLCVDTTFRIAPYQPELFQWLSYRRSGHLGKHLLCLAYCIMSSSHQLIPNQCYTLQWQSEWCTYSNAIKMCFMRLSHVCYQYYISEMNIVSCKIWPCLILTLRQNGFDVSKISIGWKRNENNRNEQKLIKKLTKRKRIISILTRLKDVPDVERFFVHTWRHLEETFNLKWPTNLTLQFSEEEVQK